MNSRKKRSLLASLFCCLRPHIPTVMAKENIFVKLTIGKRSDGIPMPYGPAKEAGL